MPNRDKSRLKRGFIALPLHRFHLLQVDGFCAQEHDQPLAIRIVGVSGEVGAGSRNGSSANSADVPVSSDEARGREILQQIVTVGVRLWINL